MELPSKSTLRSGILTSETLENFKIKNAADTLYYVPEFITPAEEELLLKNIYAAPKPKWTQLANRRLQNWGGLPHPKGMIEEPIPPWLKMWMQRINSLGVFGEKLANHVLVNEYLPGQGIMPHLDGPLFYPTITTINLKSHTVLQYYKKCRDDMLQDAGDGLVERTKVASLLLMPRSLLIVKDDFYTNFLHGIEERNEDTIDDSFLNWVSIPDDCKGTTVKRNDRISITIRHVPNTKRLGIFSRR